MSVGLRWRAIVLVYLYDIEMALVASVLGVSIRSIERWDQLFKMKGNVLPKEKEKKSSRWPENVVTFVGEYIKENPCFYLEELQEVLKAKFAALPNVSTATICRVLRFDLSITRKILTKREKGRTLEQ